MVGHDAAHALDECLRLSFHWVLVLLADSGGVDHDLMVSGEMIDDGCVGFRRTGIAPNLADDVAM